MSARSRAWSNALMDIGLTLFQLAHFCLVGFFVDAAGGGETLRMGAAIYLPVIHGAIVSYLLWNAYIKIGKKGAAAKNPETLIGIWCEVINVIMFFGVLYNFSRVVFLPSGNPIHTTSFLDNLLISVYDSSMVQGGKLESISTLVIFPIPLTRFRVRSLFFPRHRVRLHEPNHDRRVRVHFPYSSVRWNAFRQHVPAERVVWKAFLGFGSRREGTVYTICSPTRPSRHRELEAQLSRRGACVEKAFLQYGHCVVDNLGWKSLSVENGVKV